MVAYSVERYVVCRSIFPSRWSIINGDGSGTMETLIKMDDGCNGYTNAEELLVLSDAHLDQVPMKTSYGGDW